MGLRRRGGGTGPRASAFEVAELTARVARIERRLDDVEDTASALLAPDRLDDLARRVERLAARMATTEEVLEVRMHAARVAVELRQLTDDVRAGLYGDEAATG